MRVAWTGAGAGPEVGSGIGIEHGLPPLRIEGITRIDGNRGNPGIEGIGLQGGGKGSGAGAGAGAGAGSGDFFFFGGSYDRRPQPVDSEKTAKKANVLRFIFSL